MTLLMRCNRREPSPESVSNVLYMSLRRGYVQMPRARAWPFSLLASPFLLQASGSNFWLELNLSLALNLCLGVIDVASAL